MISLNFLDTNIGDLDAQMKIFQWWITDLEITGRLHEGRHDGSVSWVPWGSQSPHSVKLSTLCDDGFRVDEQIHLEDLKERIIMRKAVHDVYTEAHKIIESIPSIRIFADQSYKGFGSNYHWVIEVTDTDYRASAAGEGQLLQEIKEAKDFVEKKDQVAKLEDALKRIEALGYRDITDELNGQKEPKQKPLKIFTPEPARYFCYTEEDVFDLLKKVQEENKDA